VFDCAFFHAFLHFIFFRTVSILIWLAFLILLNKADLFLFFRPIKIWTFFCFLACIGGFILGYETHLILHELGKCRCSLMRVDFEKNVGDVFVDIIFDGF
jgi:hypothetical protein